MAACQSLLLALFSVVVLVEGGVVPDVPENKIVGGHEIDIADAPWQVSLLLNNEHHCGGSIISSQWVLSAAHCTHGLKISIFEILVGTKSITEGGIKYQVEKVVYHEKYRLGDFNDISVLKTTIQMKLDLPVKPVTLPALGAKRPPVGTKLRVSGWGKMEDGEYPTLLRAVDVVVRDYKDCMTYGASSESTEICAGASSKGSCSADSGGPLVQGNIQVGIVSFGAIETCALRPAIYADVAAYRGWIKKHTDV